MVCAGWLCNLAAQGEWAVLSTAHCADGDGGGLSDRCPPLSSLLGSDLEEACRLLSGSGGRHRVLRHTQTFPRLCLAVAAACPPLEGGWMNYLRMASTYHAHAGWGCLSRCRRHHTLSRLTCIVMAVDASHTAVSLDSTLSACINRCLTWLPWGLC